MIIKPTRGFSLLEPIEANETSEGGVYLPERVQEKPAKARVLEVGKPSITSNGLELESDIKKGDLVIHKRFVDNRIKENGKEYLLVPFHDILGVIEE